MPQRVEVSIQFGARRFDYTILTTTPYEQLIRMDVNFLICAARTELAVVLHGLCFRSTG
jgi:hypothetical protein